MIFFFSLTVDESTTTLFTANDSLTECTNYYLKILPIHESRKIAEKIIPFQTQFPPLTNLTRQLGEWSDLSQAANQRAVLGVLTNERPGSDTSLHKSLGPISASVGQNLRINLGWSQVKCAKHYQVLEYKKV